MARGQQAGDAFTRTRQDLIDGEGMRITTFPDRGRKGPGSRKKYYYGNVAAELSRASFRESGQVESGTVEGTNSSRRGHG